MKKNIICIPIYDIHLQCKHEETETQFYSIYSGAGTVEHEKKTILGYWLLAFILYFSAGGTHETMRKLERGSILRPDKYSRLVYNAKG